MRPLRILIATLALSCSAQTQHPQPKPAPTQLSPKAAYDEAMHPLEVTRHYIANWSDIEVDALKVAVGNAAMACAARDPKTFTGDNLIDLARLCTLGQTWPAVIQATTLYLASEDPSKPLLTTAYTLQIDAQLHIHDEPSALATAQTMLNAVPYDSSVAEAIDSAITYMQFVHNADALKLDALRQPLILAQLHTPAPPSADKSNPPQSIHDLYADGIAFAALQQLANQPEAAHTTLAELDDALPTTLTPDDALPIAASRKRYAFLGKPLPAIPMLDSLAMPNKLPELPAAHAVTSLLLFPDTCAYCIRMGPQFPTSVVLVMNHEAYLYGLMAETLPQRPKPILLPGIPSPKPTARELLAETPTVVVPPSVLDQFAAADFPFLIIADSHGIIRLLQPVNNEALNPGGAIDSAIALISANWPTTPPKAPTPAQLGN